MFCRQKRNLRFLLSLYIDFVKKLLYILPKNIMNLRIYGEYYEPNIRIILM